MQLPTLLRKKQPSAEEPTVTPLRQTKAQASELSDARAPSFQPHQDIALVTDSVASNAHNDGRGQTPRQGQEHEGPPLEKLEPLPPTLPVLPPSPLEEGTFSTRTAYWKTRTSWQGRRRISSRPATWSLRSASFLLCLL